MKNPPALSFKLKKIVIFGLYNDLTHFSAINYEPFLWKMCIYGQNFNKKTIIFNYFLNELKLKTICETNNTHTH